MKSFKIYTENKNEDWIKELLNISFDGFTIIYTQGHWKGKQEDSIIVEILTDDKALIKAVSQKIKAYNNQEAVLISGHDVDVELI